MEYKKIYGYDTSHPRNGNNVSLNHNSLCILKINIEYYAMSLVKLTIFCFTLKHSQKHFQNYKSDHRNALNEFLIN